MVLLGGNGGFTLSSACSVANQIVLWLQLFSTAIPPPPERCPQAKSYCERQNTYLKHEKLPALSVAVFQITFSHWKQRVFLISQLLRVENAGRA